MPFSLKHSTRLPLLFCLALILLSGCASSRARRGSDSAATMTPRTELVLLNVPEGSGWVAYRQDEQSDEVEDYRIVVLRQSNNELIYDSVIPLAASMATHGFELAKDDPRLQALAQNVDRNIIEPLEQVAQEGPPTLSDEENMESDSEEMSSPMEESESLSSVETESETSTVPSEENTTVSELTLLSITDSEVMLSAEKDHSHQVGDQFFVREPDRSVSLPGSEEQVIVSKGTVTGLLEVTEVKPTELKASLLSGYLPESPRFEKNEEE